jgi:hypothetical protein
MSGIVGGSNNRGSGLIADLGTDGQVMTSAGLGLRQIYEAAAGGANSYAGVFTFDLATATGTFTPVSGLSFEPQNLIFFWTEYAADERAGWCHLGDGVTSQTAVGVVSTGTSATGTYNVHYGQQVIDSSGNKQTIGLSAMTSDGFTLYNTKSASPTGSWNCCWLALG